MRVPYSLMRSGTSRGPFLIRDSLCTSVGKVQGDALSPEEVDVVLSIVGSGDKGQLSGVGGGSAVTSKACVVAPLGGGKRGCKYWFLQCGVEKRAVDFSHGDCGNMIAGVGVFAVANGLVSVEAGASVDTVLVHSQQTSKDFEISVPLKEDGSVEYQGDVEIAGVRGNGSGIGVHSLLPSGSTTGKLWPAGGSIKTTLDSAGITVTCVDAVRALVVVDSKSIGISCEETKDELDRNSEFMNKLEDIRLLAGKKMGLGDCSNKVSPKICVVAPGSQPGTIRARYFVAPFDKDTHPTIAMSAAQALSVACLVPGTVAEENIVPGRAVKHQDQDFGYTVSIEHPKGNVDISVDVRGNDGVILPDGSNVVRAGYLRTVQLIAQCQGYV
mmetsp:Transcript_478/g.840  ORF Transcript_478/g.840 Transcript_478/m.840 type:complete len:384 (-) Transcript_478:609-1760(-)